MLPKTAISKSGESQVISLFKVDEVVKEDGISDNGHVS